jgi:hypothetical protein
VAVEQDANRYRWLRDNSNIEQTHQIWQHVINGRGPSVDAFVDAAIKDSLTTEQQAEPVPRWDVDEDNPDSLSKHPAFQATPKPVAWVFAPNNELLWPREVEVTNPIEIDSYYPLYTTPPKRPWVGLTKVQKDDFADAYGSYESVCAIEAKLKEKNSD